MTITEVLRGLEVKRVSGPLEKEIKGIAYDSRNVKDGYLFVAIRGFAVDGHTYIKDAISRGAVGVVVETTSDLQNKIAVIEVEDSRKALASLSSVFYKEPSGELSLIGITGTDGKTTTGYITKSILEAGGSKVGLIGTINYLINDRVLTATNTTPESLDIQGYLREMVDSGVKYAVLEVSSHALALKRVQGCLFKVAAFTNFSQDHLDFHGTMDEYLRAKSTLFSYLGRDGHAVLNWDDLRIRSLAQKLDCNVITCGFEKGAMIRAENIRLARDTGEILFDIRIKEENFTVKSGLPGRCNAYNILLSIGIAYALGISMDAVVKGVRTAGPVEGRFERIEEGQEFLCIVDYAHTEEALRRLIQEARLMTERRVVTVFGCGGDRDRTKRPKMGAVASGLSDIAIITSDNPRTEEPQDIIKDISGGITGGGYKVQPDRAEAIREAVSMVGKGDTLLIAGKGHENYQEIKGIRHPFSDKEVLREAIKDLSKKGAKGSRGQGVK